MKKVIFSCLIMISIILLMSAGVYSAGWESSIMGARSAGMGNAYTGVPDTTGEAMYFNPSALGFLDNNWYVSVGANMPKLQYDWEDTSLGGTYTSEGMSVIPNAYFATGILKEKYGIDLVLGAGWYIPIGGSMDFSGLPLGGPEATDIYLSVRGSTFSPTAAYILSFSPVIEISIGAGLNIYRGKMIFDLLNYPYNSEMATSVDNTGIITTSLDADVDAAGAAIGATAGIMLKFADVESMGFNVCLGFTYRSNIDFELNGKGNIAISLPSSTIPGIWYEMLPESNKDTTILFHYPKTFQAGISANIMDMLLVSFDFGMYQWSKFSRIEINIDNVNHEALEQLYLHTGFKDAYSYRIGIEYNQFDMWAVRAGYAYSQGAKEEGAYSFLGIDPDSHTVFYGGSLIITSGDFGAFAIDLTLYHSIGKEVEQTEEEIISLNEEAGASADLPIYTGEAGIYNKNINFGLTLGLSFTIF